MTSEQLRDLILLDSAGLLDADERSALAAELGSGSPFIAAAQAEAKAIMAQMDSISPEKSPPAGTFDKIVARISAEREGAGGATLPPGSPRSMQTHEGANRARGPSRMRIVIASLTSAAIAAAITSIVAWRLSLPAREMIGARDLQLVSMSGSDKQPEARGRVLWDRDKARWQVVVFDLKPLPAGRTYELWFITPKQEKIAAGTFAIDASGHASIVVPVPANLSEIAIAAITDEPAGGVDQPTGSVQLSGKVPTAER